MQKKITLLIVDDEPVNLFVLSLVLSDDYNVRAAKTGKRALEIANSEPKPELILLDIMMPEMDGYSVLTELKKNPETNEIPVIFVTALDTINDEEKGLKMGAVDYITKPIRPAILHARVQTHLIIKQANDFLVDENNFLEAEVDRRMKENQIIQNASIRALAHLAETRDPETGDHILRTQAYVNLLARKLQFHANFKDTISNNYIKLITRSAPLHDIGKVGIPDRILLKPGKLNTEEWKIMKTHSILGAQAIEQSEKDVHQPIEFLKLAKEIAHWHHEKWDGSGYPDGLKKNKIPVSARIMALADVFDALISQRVYKAAMTPEKAKEIILEGDGQHFDPDIIQCFIQNFDKFVTIANKYQSCEKF